MPTHKFVCGCMDLNVFYPESQFYRVWPPLRYPTSFSDPRGQRDISEASSERTERYVLVYVSWETEAKALPRAQLFLLMKRPQGVEQQAGKASSAVKESGEQCLYSGLQLGLKRPWQGHLGGVHLRSPVSSGTRPVVVYLPSQSQAGRSYREREGWGGMGRTDTTEPSWSWAASFQEIPSVSAPEVTEVKFQSSLFFRVSFPLLWKTDLRYRFGGWRDSSSDTVIHNCL